MSGGPLLSRSTWTPLAQLTADMHACLQAFLLPSSPSAPALLVTSLTLPHPADPFDQPTNQLLRT